jgi:5'-nucleotidase
VAAAVAPFIAAARAERRRPVGVRLARPLTRDRRALSPFGAAAAQSVRAALGTDFALVNAGSLRLDLPAGELTYGQLYEAFPFDEGLAVIELRKEELTALLRVLSRENRGFPQAAGLRWDGSEARTCAGEPLRPDRLYTVGTNEFVASGGDGTRRVLRALDLGRITVHEEVESRAAFLDWLRKTPPGRVSEPCP